MVSKVFGSILSCDILKLQDEIDKILRLGLIGLHLDLMDGHFVNKIFLGEDIINKISLRYRNLCIIECHLMVENPLNSVKLLCLDRLHRIVIHQKKYLPQIYECAIGTYCRIGLAVSETHEILAISESEKKMIDKIMVMSVLPGEGGQKMQLERTKKAINLSMKKHKSLIVGVDGGVNEDTIEVVLASDEIVLGSCLFTKNSESTVHKILSQVKTQ